MTTQGPTTRRCFGSTRFGIEAHDADPADFPVQPSQKDGLGRMCKPHWREYTNALRKAAVARKPKAPEPETSDETPEPDAPAPRRTRRPKAKAETMETDDDEC